MSQFIIAKMDASVGPMATVSAPITDAFNAWCVRASLLTTHARCTMNVTSPALVYFSALPSSYMNDLQALEACMADESTGGFEVNQTDNHKRTHLHHACRGALLQLCLPLSILPPSHPCSLQMHALFSSPTPHPAHRYSRTL